MALKPVAATTAKWLANYQAAGPSMTAGAQAVTEAPGIAAAAQAAKWLAKLQASQAKWQARVSAVSLAQWQQAYIDLGITRGQAGATAKQGKYTNFYQQYYTFLQATLPTIKAMPTLNLQQSIAKSAAMITASAQWGAQRT